jgi:hypothetical protein
MEKFDL